MKFEKTDLLKEKERLEKENKKLKKTINKAITFLETEKCYVTVMYDNVYEKKDELLDILKGEQK